MKFSVNLTFPFILVFTKYHLINYPFGYIIYLFMYIKRKDYFIKESGKI